VSADGRLDGYLWTPNPRSAGGTYAGQGYYRYRPCILLHMTVSMSLSRSYVGVHPYPPHLWANPYTGDKWQTVELDRSALALYQPDYGYHWTNKKDYTLQTELVGVPQVNVVTYTDAHCRWIAQHVVVPQELWLRARGLTANIGNYRYHTNSSGSASVDWPGRLTEQEWADFNGLCAHIDGWAQDHWDCSVEWLNRVSQYALEILGGAPAPTPTPKPTLDDDDMMRWLQDDGGTQYAVDGWKATPIASQYTVDVMQKAGSLMTREQMIAAGYEWNIDRGSIAAVYQVQPVNENVPDIRF
jgi:hypothetical protein